MLENYDIILVPEEICEILPDISPTTIEAVLGKMVRSGQIVKIGSARNIKYLRNK